MVLQNKLWELLQSLSTTADVWSTTVTNPRGPWLQVDFGKTVTVATLRLKQWDQEYMLDWSLWSSDDNATWTKRYDVTNQSSSGFTTASGNAWIDFNIMQKTGRYWRIHCTKCFGTNFQLREVEFL